jgi:hypothetical protein
VTGRRGVPVPWRMGIVLVVVVLVVVWLVTR